MTWEGRVDVIYSFSIWKRERLLFITLLIFLVIIFFFWGVGGVSFKKWSNYVFKGYCKENNFHLTKLMTIR